MPRSIGSGAINSLLEGRCICAGFFLRMTHWDYMYCISTLHQAVGVGLGEKELHFYITSGGWGGLGEKELHIYITSGGWGGLGEKELHIYITSGGWGGFRGKRAALLHYIRRLGG